MDIKEALSCLGSTRVIWIDDHFNDTGLLLGRMLAENIEITRTCNIPELAEAIAAFEYSEETGTQNIVEALSGLTTTRRNEIKTAFFRREDAVEAAPDRELTVDEVTRACELLAISASDQWPFDGYESKVQTLVEKGDAAISYMVDLKDSNGNADDQRGLAVIKFLHAQGSKGTAFILTHEATIPDEAEKEAELTRKLQTEGTSNVPICVISKQRLSDSGGEVQDVAEALRIAIKRAGIRRSVFEVLLQARTAVHKSFDEAMSSLNSVPPEQLERYAVNQAYKEGVSEMHVIERALTAHMSQSIRTLFGTAPEVLAAAQRLRDLRAIPLKGDVGQADSRLAKFRMAEVWESRHLINTSFAQLACGDVFEVSTGSQPAKRFILLAAPCDIALRNNGKRSIDTGTFAPLKTKSDPHKSDNEKEYTLPFEIDGQRWVCDLRDTAPVRLAILDLASFREDGLVRVDKGQQQPAGLMPGQDKIYEDRTKVFSAIVMMVEADNGSSRAVDTYRDDLQLAFAAPEAFKSVNRGKFEAVKAGKGGGITAPAGISWSLRRSGRVRMPYAAAILDRYVGIISRQAFDIDYMKIEPAKPATLHGSNTSEHQQAATS
jgi:hypothetical protein